MGQGFDSVIPPPVTPRAAAASPQFCSVTDRFFAVSAAGTGGNVCSPATLFHNRCAAHVAVLRSTEVRTMLSWVVTFLVIALIAGILGFGGIAGASIEIAKIVFFVAVVLFLVSAVVGLARGRTRV